MADDKKQTDKIKEAAEAAKKIKEADEAVKKIKGWITSLKPDQRKAMESVLKPDQMAMFSALENAPAPTLADIKKFVGTISGPQATELTAKARLTGQQLAVVFSLRQLIK